MFHKSELIIYNTFSAFYVRILPSQGRMCLLLYFYSRMSLNTIFIKMLALFFLAPTETQRARWFWRKCFDVRLELNLYLSCARNMHVRRTANRKQENDRFLFQKRKGGNKEKKVDFPFIKILAIYFVQNQVIFHCRILK